jgi:DNA-binding response OmpR family regulator
MGKKILIVDDDPSMLKMVAMTLNQAGFEIVVAQDAQSASLKLMEELPDLIILDIMMPGVSGLDFLQALRSDPQGLRIPVILLSALSDVDDKVAGFKAGADEYLTKPIDARELLARVMALLNRVEAQRTDQKTPHSRLIAVMGVKGGVGATTVMMNLAGAVAVQGHRVLATELHPSAGTLSKAMGQNRGGHLGDLLARNAEHVNPKM